MPDEPGGDGGDNMTMAMARFCLSVCLYRSRYLGILCATQKTTTEMRYGNVGWMLRLPCYE